MNMSRNGVPAERRRAFSITWLLAVLAMCSLLPAFVYSSVLINRHNQAQQETLHALQYATTRSLSEAVDREVAGMVVTLRILSTSSSLQEGDLAAFHARTRVALLGTGAFLLLVGEDGQQLLNTRVDYGTPLPMSADPGPIQEVYRTGRLDISDFFVGNLSKLQVFNVISRVDTQDGPVALLMTRGASELGNALRSSAIPEGWNAALVDGDNMIAATTDDDLKPTDLFPIAVSDLEHAGITRRDLEGEATDFIVHRSNLTGWTVVTWAPVSVVTRPLVDSMLWLMGGVVLIAAVAAFAIYFVSRAITRAVRTLAVDARRLGSGEHFEARHYAVSEFEDISTALAIASHQRKQADNEINLLAREVAHRSKNQLSVLQSMAKQTAKSSNSMDEFVDDFQQRIIGLARSTDLLLNNGTSGIGLRELVEAQIQPFRPDKESRISIKGTEVLLSSAAAQNIGMALHEMATNASKYGAFSDTVGRVEVSWQWQGDKLEFIWRECEVTVPISTERRGFGTTVIEQLISSALDAEVTRTIHPDGIEWHIMMSEERLRPERAEDMAAE